MMRMTCPGLARRRRMTRVTRSDDAGELSMVTINRLSCSTSPIGPRSVSFVLLTIENEFYLPARTGEEEPQGARAAGVLHGFQTLAQQVAENRLPFSPRASWPAAESVRRADWRHPSAPGQPRRTTRSPADRASRVGRPTAD